MKELLKFKKPLFDIALNIFSNAIPLILLQLIVLPHIASALGENKYGTTIALISLVTLFAQPIGSAINNTRLLKDEEYNKRVIQGDFNILLLFGVIISSIPIVIGSIKYLENSSYTTILLLLTITITTILRIYYLVDFRINLNYFSILISSLILSIGYYLGWLAFRFTQQWELVYITGNLAVLLYIYRKSNIYKEPFRITELFYSSLSTVGILLLSSFLITATSYADKLILYPLLGTTSVSIYYSATVISKLVGMVVAPINGVMLSYLTKIKSLERKYFFQLLLVATILAVIGFLVSVNLSEYALIYLYPKWASESLEIIYYTTGAAMISLISSAINPIVLRFCRKSIQIVINGIYLLSYLCFSLFFLEIGGLEGFCIGILLSKIVYLIIKIFVFISYTPKRKISNQVN